MKNIDKLTTDITSRAEDLFRQGHNCCESVIKSYTEVLELSLPKDVYLIGRFFQQGVAGSGCICGALAGGMMMMGYLAGEEKDGKALAEKLRAGFVNKFSSTCCRVIRKKQSITGRFGNKECREITGFTAGLLREILNEFQQETNNG